MKNLKNKNKKQNQKQKKNKKIKICQQILKNNRIKCKKSIYMKNKNNKESLFNSHFKFKIKVIIIKQHMKLTFLKDN